MSLVEQTVVDPEEHDEVQRMQWLSRIREELAERESLAVREHLMFLDSSLKNKER